MIGQVMGRGLLDAFAGRVDPKEGVLFSRLVGNLKVPSWEPPRLASPPPATRLHPHGPHAELVQRALLARFTRSLIDPEAGLE